MAEISRELDQRIYGDVYERLVSLSTSTPGIPAEVARMIELRQSILAAEEAVTAADRALPFPDIAAKAAAENQRTAAEDAFVQYVEEIHDQGRLEGALTYVETTTPERPEVIQARLEQERLAREAEERAAADAARFVPQEEAARPRIYMNADFALAGLLMEVNRDLPTDPAAYANNPIIQTLITAKAQGEDAYYEAASRIVAENFENGNLDRSLYALQDSMRSPTFAATAPAEGYQRHLFMNTYLERLAAIPADATDVPPSMANLVTLARELHTMRTAPEGTHTAAAIESKTFDYLQEGMRLDRQQVPIGTFLQEKYPNGLESVGNYLAALPEVAWNNPGVLLQSAENFVGSTVGLVGDVADLADAGVGALLNNRFFQLGSPKEWFGAGDVRLGEVVSGAVVGTLDAITGRPEIRANTNDAMVMSGTENALDGIAIVASLGTAGVVKAGVKTAVRVGLREGADDAARIIVRNADEVAAPATAAATTATLTNVTNSLGAIIPRATAFAQESYMGLKNNIIRWLTRTVDDAAPAVARTADDVAPAVARTAADDAAALAAARRTADAVADAVPGLASRFSSAVGNLFSKPMTLGGIMTFNLGWAATQFGIAATEVHTGGALSEAALRTVVSTTRAAIQSGAVTAETLERHIDGISAVASVFNALDKSAQNAAVAGVMMGFGDQNSPEAITAGKNMAMSWLLQPSNAAAILGKHMVRAQVIDDAIPDRAAADRALAERLVDDIVAQSQTHALGNNQVTRDDVKAHIARVMAEPNNPLGQVFREGRVANGMRQMWPDLYQQPAATPTPDTRTPARLDFGARVQDSLTGFATQMNGIPGMGWLGAIVSVIAAVVGFVRDMFNGPNTTAQTDNPERLRALASNLGETALLPRVTHDGTPADPVTVTPADRRPAIIPGLTVAAP